MGIGSETFAFDRYYLPWCSSVLDGYPCAYQRYEPDCRRDLCHWKRCILPGNVGRRYLWRCLSVPERISVGKTGSAAAENSKCIVPDAAARCQCCWIQKLSGQCNSRFRKRICRCRDWRVPYFWLPELAEGHGSCHWRNSETEQGLRSLPVLHRRHHGCKPWQIYITVLCKNGKRTGKSRYPYPGH